MHPHHAGRVEELFHAIVDLTPTRRAARLARQCGDDAELRRQVESLVAAWEHVTTVFGSLERIGGHEAATDTVVPPSHPRYRIVRELGRGGMGIVYLADDLQLGRSVALKFLPARLAEDRLARAQLVAEGRAAAMLDHPNIATVFEIGESDEGRLFIAMAYYEGETLRERLERAPLAREEAVAIAVDAAQGLAAAHAQGLVHRDIKPGNLLITANGRVKILDFGLAERADPDRTMSTHAMGTLAYMSPEQARGETVDARTDLWSLGVVLYEMLARRRPFMGDSALALLYAILHETPPALEADCPPSLRQVLDRALAKVPAARYQHAGEFLAALQSLHEAERLQPAAAPPVYLTSFVGRERELAQGRSILRTARLVTMTGPPGTGKTRLAARLAEELGKEFRDGAVFVALAVVTDTALFLSTLAQALGVRVAWPRPLLEVIATHLRDRHLLLVLDNFEQILPAADQVRALVSTCARLTVLVTSRAPLRLSGEREFPIPPLACPGPDASGAVDDAVAEAVALFVDRAVAIQPGFQLTPQNAPAIADICRRLDGLPLAIELAAARVKVLPPQALLTRLGKRLDLLKGGARDLPSRHQTLRQAIAWSYDLLDADDQTLLRRLSVFAGGHTVEAAETVVGPSMVGGVLEGLASLVDKNLLRQETQPDGEPRFTTLETIREFGLERLGTAGEEGEARRAHRNVYLGIVERASADLSGPQQVTWLDQLAREHENLRLALEWSVASGEWEPAERLAAGLWRFWLVRGHLTEGRNRLQHLLSLTPARSPRRPLLLTAAGTLAHNQGDYAAARSFYEDSLALSRARGDEATVAGTLNDLGWVAWRQGDYGAARALSEEALAVHRRLGDQRGTAHALNNLGWVAHHEGDYTRAAAFHREGLGLREQSGDTRGIGFALTNLGWATHCLGDVESARQLLDRACGRLSEVGERQLLAFAVTVRAMVRRDTGEPRAALAALDESSRTFRQIGDRWGLAFTQNATALVWHALGEHDRAGRSAAEALALAREIGDRWGTAQACAAHAVIAAAAGCRNESLGWWRQALTLWAQLGDRANVAACLRALADLIGAADPMTAGRLDGAAEALQRRSGEPATAKHRQVDSAQSDVSEPLEQARMEGAAMSFEDVIALALMTAAPPTGT